MDFMPLKVIRDTEPKIEADVHIPGNWTFSEKIQEEFECNKLLSYYKDILRQIYDIEEQTIAIKLP